MRIVIAMIMSTLICTEANALDFVLKSSAFSNNGTIPSIYTCNGQNMSPPLTWENAPANTQSFALIFKSPDTPMGTLYLWVLYNIPNTVKSLAEAQDISPDQLLTGSNSFSETSYRGPCPPDEYIHRYVFIIYALDAMLDLRSGADFSDVITNIKRHEIKHAELIGIFRH